jgi:hypothetical protein
MATYAAIFAVVFLGLTVWQAVRVYRAEGTRKKMAVVGGAMMLVGGAGFLGTMLVSLGAITPPNTFQWPAGMAPVVFTASGEAVVPIVPAGRIQIYDSSWHFKRGWQIAAQGGDFKIAVRAPDLIDVFTMRGDTHFVFKTDGTLVSHSVDTVGLVNSKTADRFVPGQPLLFPLSDPAYCWSIGAMGLLLTIAANPAAVSKAMSARR